MKQKKELKNIQDNKRSSLDKLYLFLVFLYLVVYMFPFPEQFGYIPFALVIVYSLITKSLLKFRLSAYHWWNIQILIFFVISSLWALRPILSFWVVMQMLKLIVFTFSVYKYCSSTNRLFDILKVSIFTNILLLLFILFYFDISSLGEDRMSDTQNGLNGNFIAINFTFCLYSFFIIYKLFKVGYRTKFFYTILSIIFFVAILFTGSRAAIVLLVVPISLYQFLKSKHKVISVMSISFLMLITFFIVMEIPVFYNVIGYRLEDGLEIITGNSDGSQDTTRVLLFAYGIEWFKENPIIGIGINNYRVLSNVTFPFVGFNFNSHSNIIELLVDVGVIGFVIYYRYLFIVIRNVKKVKDIVVKRIVVVLTITLFINDIFSVTYYQMETYFYFCITFVLLSLFGDEKEKRRILDEHS